MSNYKEHKHASVLRAIADGVPLSEFEVRLVSRTSDWAALHYQAGDMILLPDQWEVRRKPQYIVVNGFKVPKPLESLLYMQEYHVVAIRGCIPTSEECCNSNTTIGITHCSSGLVHLTKEAAIAHAKAILGINPKWEEKR